MKRILSLMLTAIMLLGVVNPTAMAAEEKVLFQDDFYTESISWEKQGPKWKDDKLVFSTTNMVFAWLGSQKFMFNNPYSAEFDFKYDTTLTEHNEQWLGFNAGGVMVFFRIFNGTVHGTANDSGESKIGNAKLEPGKTYTIKTSVGDGYVAVYYKGETDSSFREIGSYANAVTSGNNFQIFSRLMSFEIDNVKITSDGGSVVPSKKVMEMEVGAKEKIEVSGKNASGVTFESSAPELVAVAADGTVEAKANGSAIITIKTADGKVGDTVFVRTMVTPKTVTFDYNPIIRGNHPYASNQIDNDKIILEVGEMCDLRAALPGSATLKGIDWTTDKEGIVSLYGSYASAPTRAITGVAPGEVVITAKSRYTEAQAKMAVKVIPAGEGFTNPSDTYTFFKTGDSHPYDERILGVHTVDGQVADKMNESKLINEIGAKSIRTGIGFIKDDMYDAEAGETKAGTVYRVGNNANVLTIYDFSSADITGPEDYDRKIADMVQEVKDIQKVTEGPLYLELFNEQYAIQFKKQFPKIEDYVEFCKKAVTEIRKVAPDTYFMAVGMYYASYLDITYDEGNFVATGEGDPAFTQGWRVKYWNEKVKELVDEGYVQGITLHPYQGGGSNMNGMTGDNFFRARMATVDMNYFGSLWDQRSFDYKADFHFTEWGQLQSLIYWGAAAGDAEEKKRYNYQKYPLAALANMKSIMTFMKLDNVKSAQFHAFIGIDGFGIIDEFEVGKDYKIPNRTIFEKMSNVATTMPVYYDISPADMNYTVVARPWWNGGEDEKLSVADVEAYGFGDANGLKQVAFFNQTENPQTVKLDGAKLKPDWSYGGDIDTIMPEWLRNTSWNSWAEATKNYRNFEDFVKPAQTYEGAAAADELVIPPYTMMFAVVDGTAETQIKTAETQMSRLADYAMRNYLALNIGNSVAFADKVKKTIDESPAVTPVIENGRTLLPLRFVAESLGCEVGYDEATKKVTVKDAKTEVILTLGETAYTVNGEAKQLDIPAKVTDGRTMLPLRAVAEAIGKEVYWDDRGYILIGTKSYTIDSDIKYYFDEVIKAFTN